MSSAGCTRRAPPPWAEGWCFTAGKTGWGTTAWTLPDLTAAGRRVAEERSLSVMGERLREVYRLNSGRLRQGYDMILVARGRTLTASWKELNDTFLRLCRKLELLEVRS